MVGEDAARSTTTTFACRAIRRASVKAVSVMLSLDAVPRIVTLRAAPPAWTSSSASCSISSIPHRRSRYRVQTGAGFEDLQLASKYGAVGGDDVRIGAGEDRSSQRSARGAVMRSNSPVTIAPEVSSKVASVAISTIGSFFG